tara:strand:- start:388 stop:537 length:150 start_codon:yes stop_codon:yes gene_type:complete
MGDTASTARGTKNVSYYFFREARFFGFDFDDPLFFAGEARFARFMYPNG